MSGSRSWDWMRDKPCAEGPIARHGSEFGGSRPDTGRHRGAESYLFESVLEGVVVG
jgi:hypothetical protein